MTEDLDSPDNLWWGVNGIQRLVSKAARLRGKSSDEIDGEKIFKWAEEGDEDILYLLDEFTKKPQE